MITNRPRLASTCRILNVVQTLWYFTHPRNRSSVPPQTPHRDVASTSQCYKLYLLYIGWSIIQVLVSCPVTGLVPVASDSRSRNLARDFHSHEYRLTDGGGFQARWNQYELCQLPSFISILRPPFLLPSSLHQSVCRSSYNHIT